MKSIFEIEWCGGAAEKHYRKLRPLDTEMPWGTIDLRGYAPELVQRSRVAWTSVAISEYRAAVALADLQRAMLIANTPLDLVGMAGDFVADEALHVELASRLAMELGGGAPIEVDLDSMSNPRPEGASAIQHANELVLRVACVAETLSGAFAVETLSVVTHPLMSAVVERIARDESRHKRLGWLYMDWAAEDMDDAERVRLGRVATSALLRLSPVWRRTGSGAPTHELGWLEPEAFRSQAIETIRDEILTPLERLGIQPDRAALDGILRTSD
jgi:hypothetical protein